MGEEASGECVPFDENQKIHEEKLLPSPASPRGCVKT